MESKNDESEPQDKASRIEKIDEKIEQLRNRRDRLRARERQTLRKIDTRRKIILGGTVLAMLRENEPAAHVVLAHARARSEPRDQVLLHDVNHHEGQS